MAPVVALLINALLPVAVNEVKKKLAEDEATPYQVPQEVPISVAAPIAVREATVGMAKSKTVWFSVALGILGVVEAHSGMLIQHVGAENIGWILAAIAGVSGILRTITTSSIVDK